MGLFSSIRGSTDRPPAAASDNPAPASQTAQAGKQGKQPVKLQGVSLLNNRPVGGDGFSLVADSADTFKKFGFRLPS